MGSILSLIGLICFIGFIIILLIGIAKRQDKNKKRGIIGVILSIVLFVAGMLMPSTNTSTSANGNIKNATQSSSKLFKSVSSKNANKSGAITKDAYDKIKTGMTLEEAEKIIGSNGKNIFESGDKGTDSYQISYMWLGENGGEATISFTGKNKLVVQLKSQSGLK